MEAIFERWWFLEEFHNIENDLSVAKKRGTFSSNNVGESDEFKESDS